MATVVPPLPNVDTLIDGQAKVSPSFLDWLSRLALAVAGGGGGGSGTVTSVAGVVPITITGVPAVTPIVNVSDFVASGVGHARGTVPDPGAAAGTAKFLREDATWQTPAGTGTVTVVTGTAPIVITGAPAVTPNVTVTDFVASGAGHARGAVPDPGAVAGTTKFLREDATWQTAGGTPSPLTTKGDIWGFTTVDARVPIGATLNMSLLVDATQAPGLKWAFPPSANSVGGFDWGKAICVTHGCMGF